MRFSRRQLFLLYSALLWLPITQAESLTVVTENFPPYNFEQNGEVQGYSTEIVKAVLAEASIDYHIRVAVWKGAFKLARQKPNVLIYSIGRTQEREDQFRWIGELSSAYTGIWRLKKRSDIEINRLEDLSNYRVAMLEEGYVHQFFKTHPEYSSHRFEFSREIELNVRKLFAERVDLITAPNNALYYEIEKNDYDRQAVEEIFKFDNRIDIYMALSLQTSDRVYEKLTTAFRKVEAEGLIESLQKRYFPSLDTNH